MGVKKNAVKGMEVLGPREVVKRAAILAMMSGTAVNVVGPTGIGKTDMAGEIAKEFKRKFYAFNSAINNTEDLIGIPYIDHEKNETHWSKPYWFPDTGKFLILIDEINRAEKNTLNALLPFILSGTLHEHQLPKGVWIMTASNPDSDDYDLVNSFEDKAVYSRMCILNLGVDPYSWGTWLKETKRTTKHLQELMKDTLERNNTLLPELQTPNPRSFAKMVDMLKTAKKYNKEKGEKYFTDEVVLKACTGMVGSEFVTKNSTAIISELNEEEEKTLEDILNTEVNVANVLQIKNELVRALADPIEDKELIDKLYDFVLTNGKRFPGQFMNALLNIKGPWVNYVNDLTIKLKNAEAESYDSKIGKYEEE